MGATKKKLIDRYKRILINKRVRYIYIIKYSLLASGAAEKAVVVMVMAEVLLRGQWVTIYIVIWW